MEIIWLFKPIDLHRYAEQLWYCKDKHRFYSYWMSLQKVWTLSVWL